MRDAQERRHVVLAVALHADVAQHDEVVVATGLIEGLGKRLRGIEAVAGIILLVSAHDAARGLLETFARGIVARPRDQGANGFLGLGLRGPPARSRLQGDGGLPGRDVVHGWCWLGSQIGVG